jgi:hypothetical protein
MIELFVLRISSGHPRLPACHGGILFLETYEQAEKWIETLMIMSATGCSIINIDFIDDGNPPG